MSNGTDREHAAGRKIPPTAATSQHQQHQQQIALLLAFQDAINLGDHETAAALFTPEDCITDEGVHYRSVRDVLAYLAGSQAQLTLGDFALTADGGACTYHEVNALDQAVGYGGSSRRAEATFTSNWIAALVIAPLAWAERQRTLQLVEPFFSWFKAQHPEEWAAMSQLSYESGATLAWLARVWAASGGRRSANE